MRWLNNRQIDLYTECVNNSIRAIKVWFDEDNMWVSLEDGRILAVPRVWFPSFSGASKEQLKNYEMSGNGIGLHWDELDEDISVPNLLLGYGAVQGHGVLRK